ncbi:hypothetical protein F5Y08DRAFT_330780 [Xylaria arbuscula]|nr:hypothetical protein F5Y08DRAFT_330780 [Xylaria arbuscula]
MAPVTEIVLLTLISNADYSPIIESVKILALQPGCLAVRVSCLHEEPDKVHYFIDWDSVESHFVFARNKEVYAPFRALVGSVMADFTPPYHVPLAPNPLTVFGEALRGDCDDDNAVMIGKAWFPGIGEFTAEEMEGVFGAFERFVRALTDGNFEGFSGRVARGWSLEDGISYEGDSARVFLFAVKWDSIKSYTAFRQCDKFGEVCSAMTGLNKQRGLEMCLVNLTDTHLV